MTNRLSPKRSERGSQLVEFALVVPIFAFILYALIAFGMQLATTQRVTNAAAEGARFAVGANSDAVAQSQATARITAVLGAPNGRYDVTFPTPSCTGCINVRLTYHYDSHYPVPPPTGFHYSPIVSNAVVQYK